MFPFLNKMLLGGSGGPLNVDDVFATTLYTGDGTASSVPLSFAPELTWDKLRSMTSNNVIRDVSRPGFALATNDTIAQVTTGVTVDGSSKRFQKSFNGASIVNWSFRRAPKFFDIVTYTGNGVAGRQIAHNLGVKPGVIVVKRLDGSGTSWAVHHQSIPNTSHLILNSTSSQSTSPLIWASDPTEEVFTVANQAVVNSPNDAYVAYLFAHDPSPSGIIQCGQYTGNGSATGPVVTLGWEPQWWLVKCVSAVGDWYITDNKRSIANPRTRFLKPNTTGVETTIASAVDFLPTGFQIKSSDTTINTNGRVYIYMAIRKGSL